ncbi:MAG: N-acetyltransferase [bacterium]|nr:N-acetyltransferase [bacterium]
MSEIIIKEVTAKKELHQFICFPYELYKNDPNWVPPLIIEREEFFDPRKNPFYDHAEIKLFLALKNDKPVGRISAHINFNHNDFYKDKVGFFGFFECEKDYLIAEKLLSAASSWLKLKGMDTVRGPMNFSTNEECGLLIKGYDSQPVLMMSYNPPYYADFLESYGYKKEMDLIAYDYKFNDVPEYIKKVSDRLTKRKNVVVRPINPKKFREEVELIKKIYSEAWKENWGFVPMTDKEFEKTAKDFKMIMDKDMILFAEIDGKPIAFFLALPDLNLALKKIKGKLLPFGLIKLLLEKRKIAALRVLTMGVVEEYRHWGIDVLLYNTGFNNAVKNGYRKVEYSWILESNEMMNRILIRMGADPYKTYRIYDKKL